MLVVFGYRDDIPLIQKDCTSALFGVYNNIRGCIQWVLADATAWTCVYVDESIRPSTSRIHLAGFEYGGVGRERGHKDVAILLRHRGSFKLDNKQSPLEQFVSHHLTADDRWCRKASIDPLAVFHVESCRRLRG